MRFKFLDLTDTQVKTEKGTISLKTLFIPLFIEQLLMNMMGTVNTIILGHYSDEAVAAVGAANQVIGLIYTFYAVISGGVSIVISHKLGAGKEQEAEDAALSAVLVGTVISFVSGLLLALGSVPLMKMLNLQGEVLDMAIEYFIICIRFSFLQGILSSVFAIFRSYGRPNIAVMISLLMNLINAALDYLIIYRPVDIPLYGSRGIAIANVISHIVALVIVLVVVMQKGKQLLKRLKNIQSLKYTGEIIKVGIPGGVSSLSYSLSQVVSTGILAGLGTIALSTKIYISSIVFYVYVVGYSLGISLAILIGWMIGAGQYERAYKLNQQVLKLSVSLNIVMSIVLFFNYRFFVGLFTGNEQIIAMARGILFIDIFVEIGRAFNHVEENSLRGAGDVNFPMIVSILSCWFLSILFSYILGIGFGMGLYGCWIAFMLDELFRGLMFFYRFRSRKWMQKKLI